MKAIHLRPFLSTSDVFLFIDRQFSLDFLYITEIPTIYLHPLYSRCETLGSTYNCKSSLDFFAKKIFALALQPTPLVFIYFGIFCDLFLFSNLKNKVLKKGTDSDAFFLRIFQTLIVERRF